MSSHSSCVHAPTPEGRRKCYRSGRGRTHNTRVHSPTSKKSNRVCKYGELVRPVPTEKGGTRYCKLPPR